MEKTISKFEMAALKRLYKNINPQLKKVERINKNIEELEKEKISILQSIRSTEDLMNSYTQGVNYMDVLFPNKDVEITVDSESEVPMTEVKKEEELEVFSSDFFQPETQA